MPLLLGQLSANLGDGQVHRGEDDARLKGLILADKGMVITPYSGQDSTDQDIKGNIIKRLDRVRIRKKEIADIIRYSGSFLYIF